MKTDKILKFALVASLVLNITLLATAGYRYHQKTSTWLSPFGGRMPMDRFLFDELSLKPEQREAMKAKAVPFRAEIDQRRQEIIQKRKELIVLMRAGTPDNKAIHAKIAEISRMQETMQQRITGHMLAEKALLDRDQQQKFLDLIERRMTGGPVGGCPPMEQGQ